MQKKRQCLFCGAGSKMSKEHIWAEWSKDQHRKSGMYGIVKGKADKAERTTSIHTDYERRGALSTYKVLGACIGCNNGWMSRYENDLKPVLKTMMRGESLLLDPENRLALTEYLTFKILLLDADHDPLYLPDVAHAFYKERTLPENMDIHIFNCADGNWTGIRRIGGAFAADMTNRKMAPNVFSVAIGFNKLFIFAVLRNGGTFSYDFAPGTAIRLLPLNHPTMKWPPLLSITSYQAEEIASIIYHLGSREAMQELVDHPLFGKLTTTRLPRADMTWKAE
jgi:hypothetical protein